MGVQGFSDDAGMVDGWGVMLHTLGSILTG